MIISRYTYQNLSLSEKCKVGNDGRNLVQITTSITSTKKRKWSITVYDLRHHGFHAVTKNRPLNIELKVEHEIFNLDLCAILVARYSAVLCFKGTGEDTPQEMIAIDLTPGKIFRSLSPAIYAPMISRIFEEKPAEIQIHFYKYFYIR